MSTRKRSRVPILHTAGASFWRRRLKVCREKTINNIRKLAKKAGMDPPKSLPNDDEWILYAIKARHQWRNSPTYFKQRGYGDIADALESIDDAQQNFDKAGESLGGLNDVRAILKQLLNKQLRDG